MNILMIAAHPDDNEFRCSGLAMKYLQDGHRVRFLSMLNGCGGHHILGPDEIKERRRLEVEEVKKLTGLEYDIWDIPDCTLVADLPTREKLIRYIRAFNPDLVICHRINDYHADHRNSGLLVQDAAYLLIVPNYLPDAPAMKKSPVILFNEDAFKNPPFCADIVIDIDDVVEKKFRLADKHVSQVYEWLPYTYGTIDQVPSDPAARFEWLKGGPIDKDTTDETVLHGGLTGYSRRFALPAALHREKLIKRYGQEKGSKIRFAEAYQISEYGSPLTPELEKQLIPY